MSKDEELDSSVVLRAAQRPALMAYVPIGIFIGELLAALLLFRIIGIWVLILLPIHGYFVIKTDKDVHWVTALRAWYKLRLFANNKGLRDKDVVTFTASPIKSEKNDYADLH